MKRVSPAALASLAQDNSPRLAFNPDEAQLDPRAILDDLVPQQEPSALESFGRGALQGVTGGFADEITGAIEHAITGKRYAQARDESRANYKAAEEANPTASLAGNVGGGLASIFLPGAGVTRAATVAGRIGAGAALGGLAGLGNSEADLTKGDVAGAARDTAIGAAAGGALTGAAEGLGSIFGLGKKAVGEVVDDFVAPKVSAEARAHAAAQLKAANAAGADALAEAELKFAPLVAKDEASAVQAVHDPLARKAAVADSLRDSAMEDLQFIAGNKVKLKAFGDTVRKEVVEDVMGKDKPLQVALAAGERHAALEHVEGKLGEVGKRLDDEVYDLGQEHTAGAARKNVLNKLLDVHSDYERTTAEKPLAKIVSEEMQTFRQHYDKFIPLQDLRLEYRRWQDMAEKARNALSGDLSPRMQVADRMARAMREALHEEIETVAKRVPELADLPQKLSALNEEASGYAAIKDVLKEAVRRQNAAAPTFGEFVSPLKEIRAHLERKGVEAARGGLAGLESLRLQMKAGANASGNVAGAAAAGASGSAATRALAKLISVTRGGAATAEKLAPLAEDAIAAGVPRALVGQIVGVPSGD